MHKNRISVHIIFALLEKDRRLEVLNYFAIITTHKTRVSVQGVKSRAAILHVYAGGLNFMKYIKKKML